MSINSQKEKVLDMIFFSFNVTSSLKGTSVLTKNNLLSDKCRIVLSVCMSDGIYGLDCRKETRSVKKKLDHYILESGCSQVSGNLK